MRRLLIKTVVALACLALVSVQVPAQKGGGGGSTGGGSSCAGADIQLSNYTASTGGWVGVYGTIQNCSPSKKRYTIDISAKDACGVETMISHYRSAFNAGENKLYSITYVIAPNTCRGSSTVTVTVFDGSTILTGASTALTVQ
jgi:hypothetical protein